MPEISITMPRLHPGQVEVRRSRARYRVIDAGRRWGKSKICLSLALEQLLLGHKGWWVVPDFKNHGLGTWRSMVESVAPLERRGLVRIRTADRTIENLAAPGSFIAWKDAKGGSLKLRSDGIHFAVIDEAAYMDGDAWFSGIRPALSDFEGSAVFASTPKQENDWFHRLFKRGQSDDPDDVDYQSWQFPTETSPFISDKEVAEARRDYPNEIDFRREFCAEFLSAEGARIKRDWICYGEPPAKQSMTIAMGVDLAISEKKTADFTAVAVLGRHRESGALYVLDVKRERVGFRDAQKLIVDTAADWSPDIVAVEKVGYQAAVIEELMLSTSLPIKAMKPKGDKVARFAGLESRYHQNSQGKQRFIVHSHDLPAVFETELLSFPETKHDDQVDALAYAFHALNRRPDAPYVPRSRRARAPTFRI